MNDAKELCFVEITANSKTDNRKQIENFEKSKDKNKCKVLIVTYTDDNKKIWTIVTFNDNGELISGELTNNEDIGLFKELSKKLSKKNAKDKRCDDDEKIIKLAISYISKCKSVEEFLRRLPERKNYYDNDIFFRGQRRIDWELTAKVDRKPFFEFRTDKDRKISRIDQEKQILEEFRKYASSTLTFDMSDDLNWLVCAQHYGLATRLIDWTVNPLVALYFAVEKESSEANDAVVCSIEKPDEIDKSANFWGIKRVASFNPNHLDPRVACQAGRFTVHPELQNGTSETVTSSQGIKDFELIVIDGEKRQEIKRQLSNYGISRATLFPGLEGYAAFANWVYNNEH